MTWAALSSPRRRAFYKGEGLDINLYYSQSNAAVAQALTSGSTTIAIASGLTDPMYAVASGADIAIVRIDGQWVGPLRLMGSEGTSSRSRT